MKAPTTKLRFSEAQKLLDYGFNNYSYKELAKKDSIIKKVNITKGTENELNATYKEDFGTLLKKEMIKISLKTFHLVKIYLHQY